MKRLIFVWLLLISMCGDARAQACYGGMCYPQQPSAPARFVMPLESAAQTRHDAHCRIHVGDGLSASNFVGSGTLIAKNDATGLVLTCSHLFDSATSSIIVEFPDGRRFGGRLIDRDAANDLAAVLIQRPNAVPLTVQDDDPTGVLTACGFGGNGQFRPASGPISGAVQAVGATFPSLKIASTVRPGDSGGGVLDRAGRLVGVVWGCRDGETYLTCGKPLRNFLQRILPKGERASAIADSTPALDPEAWRAEIESRFAELDAKKQDRGDYLQVGDLNAYATTTETRQAAAQAEQASTSRLELLRTAIIERIEQRVGGTQPGLLSGLSFGKLVAGALGLSGPVALAVIIAGGLAGRRIKNRLNNTPSSMLSASRSTPIAVDSPPPPQAFVPESHYVPVERDDFARAHQWAREQVARKYPGATEVLSTLESLIKQQLAGN